MSDFVLAGVSSLETVYQPRVAPIDAPPAAPPTLVQLFPGLSDAIALASGRPNLYWETWPSSTEVRKWGWARFDQWSDSAQENFEREWTSDHDNWVDLLIASHASSWHLALPFLAKRDHPELLDGPISLKYGPWCATVKRRKWAFPTLAACTVCGVQYYVDSVRYYLVRRWGEPGICPRCGFGAMMGEHATLSLDKAGVESALEELKRLADIVGVIPPQNFRTALGAEGLDPASRARLVAALLCAPNVNALKSALGVENWIDVLRAAGLVGDAWRASRGFLCTAADGHPCRSLGERSIDDWLHRHRITHEIEPRWPVHEQYNPNRRLRGDWRLPDGTIVEYAGLDHDAYLAKIEKKRLLARTTGTKLLVIMPEDLTSLERMFRPWMTVENPVLKQQTPASTAPSSSRPLSDAGALLKLEAWVKKLPVDRHGDAISTEQIDMECGLAGGTAERLVVEAAKRAGDGTQVRGPVDGIVMLTSDMRVLDTGRPRGGWSPSRDGFGGL